MELRDTSLMVQWLGLCTSTAGGMGLIPGQGTKIPQAMQRGGKLEWEKVGKSSEVLELNWRYQYVDFF